MVKFNINLVNVITVIYMLYIHVISLSHFILQKANFGLWCFGSSIHPPFGNHSWDHWWPVS